MAAEVMQSTERVRRTWTNFTATGNPNGGGAPLWAVFTAGSGPFLAQDIPNTNESVAAYRSFYHCDFWDTQITYPVD